MATRDREGDARFAGSAASGLAGADDQAGGAGDEAGDKTGEVAGVVRRNIRALINARTHSERSRSLGESLAVHITTFTGSLKFVLLHAAVFGAWILVNLGVLPWVRPFDPFPFVMLAMVASVEAIFLSTFVLISQNLMAALAERRADLDLQINLLSEHEVTRLIKMVDAIAQRLGVNTGEDGGLEELKRDVPPEMVLGELDRAARPDD